MKNLLGLAVSASLGFGSLSAGAVVLDPHGLGQVLIYPYYTVNGGHATLFSIVNTSEHGKALKLHFREGLDGRPVLGFNLYLSPLDVWVAEILDTSADGTGPAVIASSDQSCTVPQLSIELDPGRGIRAQPFVNFGYSGDSLNAKNDGGPRDLGRTREGYFEVIEMGEVTNAVHDTLAAIEHDSTGKPKDCAQLNAAWSPQGYWMGDSRIDLAPPGGGLYGAESIVNVADGTLYAVDAAAIDGFSSVVQHTIPSDATPDLSSASPSANGTISAFVPVPTGMARADYDHPEDAVSALFMVDSLYNEYVVDPAVGAASDWVVTFPTKRFYTDPDLLAGSTQARAPFDKVFDGNSCSQINPQTSNREDQIATTGCGAVPGCPANTPDYGLCYAANVLTIGTTASVLASKLPHASPAPSRIDTASVGFVSGQLRLDLTQESLHGTVVVQHALGSTNGVQLAGLPALGFLAVDYVNANVTPGVLANYSGAYAHRAHVTCARSTSPQVPCP